MNDPKPHAVMPWLCTDCRDIAERLAEQHPDMPTTLKACRHSAPGAVVVAVGFTRGGQIHKWTLEGPLSEQQAEAAAVAYVQAVMTAAQQHLHVPPGATRQ